MAHVRTQIRQAVVAALAAGSTLAAANVADSRVSPWPAGITAALSVHNGPEQSEPVTIGAPVAVMDRAFALRVRAYVSDGDAAVAAETLDTLMAQVETVIAVNCHAGGAQLIYPTGSDFEDEDSGDSTAFRGYIDLQCRYTTSQVNPQVIR